MVANPLMDSLEALTVEQRFEVLDWLQSNLESSEIPEAHRRILDARFDACGADHAAGVMLSPVQSETDRDLAAIRQSMDEIDEGKGISIDDMHARLRSELLAMQAARNFER